MDALPESKTTQQVLTVSELTARVKSLLEDSFPDVWVGGEISEVSRPRSGHLYLTLKDENSQIRAVVWRNTASSLRFDIEEGLEVICRGDIDVYAPRGSYQLVIRQIEPKGIGALQLAFRRLHTKLAKEGLFDEAHKKPLPRFPRKIALVTSPSGAAVRDFLEVLSRRWPDVAVLVIPTRVQGDGAAEEIANAIRLAHRVDPLPDVMVVTRGGGSLEDLWSFNEEVVVREIFSSKIPVVSAVGHEIDVTLADFVADVRALTPTEAAERVLPDVQDVRRRLGEFAQRLLGLLHRQASQGRLQLDGLAERRVLKRPFERLLDLARRLDDLEQRSLLAIRGKSAQARDRLAALAGRLNSLSPLAVLGRGYSITTRTLDGQPVDSADTLTVGEKIASKLAHGEVISQVEKIHIEE